MIKVIGECLVKIFPVLLTLLLANDCSIKISRVVTGYRIKLFLNIFRENIDSRSRGKSLINSIKNEGAWVLVESLHGREIESRVYWRKFHYHFT